MTDARDEPLIPGAPSRPRRLIAAAIVWTALALLIGVYAGLLRAPFEFIKHLDHRLLPPLPLLGGGVWLFVVVIVTPFGERGRDPLRFWIALGLWVGLLVVFRDRLRALGDSASLLRDPIRRLEAGGWYTFYDELVGMWLPLRLARGIASVFNVYTKPAIVAAYSALSFVGGGLFFCVAQRLANTLPSPRFALLLLLGAAHSLHFAGYVENYALSSLLLTYGVLLTVENHVKPALRITLVFAAAVVCHAVAVWSVFALVYMAIRSRAFVRTAAIHTAAGLGLVGVVVLLFSLWLTPGVGFAHVHGDTLLANLVETLRTRSLADHAGLLLRTAAAPLLAIALGLLVQPRAALARLRRPDAIFVLLYLAGFVVHQLVWKSTISLPRDWDLFGYTWLPLVYLAALVTPRYLPLELGLAILQAAVGFSWLLRQANLT